MNSLPCRLSRTKWVFASCLVCWASGVGNPSPARAQTTGSGPSPPTARATSQDRGDASAPRGESGTPKDAGGATKKAQASAKAKVQAKVQEPRHEPSAAFKESIRKTLEKRRARRARRAQAQGLDAARPIGAIVPWPMPPALIIRHTAGVHDEVDSLLGQLRRSGP